MNLSRVYSFEQENLLYLLPFLVAGVAVVAASSPAVTVVGVLIFVSIAGFVRWDQILYLIALLLPLNPLVEVLPIHDVLSAAHIALFIGVLLRKMVIGESLAHWLIKGKIAKLIIGYAALTCFSSLTANHLTLAAAQSLFRLFAYLSLFYVVKDWITSEEEIRRMCIALFLSTTAISVLAICQVASGDFGNWWRILYQGQEQYFEPWQGRASSVFLHVNPLAAYVNLATPLALAAWRLKILKGAAAGCFILGTIALLLTESRGGEIAFLVAILFVLKYTGVKINFRKIFLITVLLSLVALGISSELLVSTGSDAIGRFTSLDAPTLVRLGIYANALAMFHSAPLLGVGYGNFRGTLTGMMLDKSAPPDVWDAHNLYLKILAETGIVGFLLFFWFVLVLLRRSKAAAVRGSTYSRLVALGAFAASITMLVHGTVDVMNDVAQFGSLLFLVYGLFVAQLKEQNIAKVAPGTPL